MAAIILDSLVLPGVAVRSDALVVDVRLGATIMAEPQAPGNRNSLRPPMPGGSQPEPQGVLGREVDYPTSGATPAGAGRSRCLPSSFTSHPAAFAGLAWRKPEGRTPPATAAC
jgi:hypothetical protein